jgi:hypothetical protein
MVDPQLLLGRYCRISHRPLCLQQVMEIFVTSFSLIAAMYGGSDILWRSEDSTTLEKSHWMLMSIQVISILYIWEILYRESFGWPLLIHHLMTLLFSQLVTATFSATKQFSYIRFALILSFYATTEQLSFIALLFFRLNVF